jgi:hypothetical protein
MLEKLNVYVIVPVVLLPDEYELDDVLVELGFSTVLPTAFAQRLVLLLLKLV